jgi:hypothetical protein
MLLLDNEPVQALLDPTHPKHPRVIHHLDAIRVRRKRSASGSSVVVPTSVRVDAGWNRQSHEAAAINRFPIVDHALTGEVADAAAAVRERNEVSIGDAHIGVAARSIAGAMDVVVLTSDVEDIRAAAAPFEPRLVPI